MLPVLGQGITLKTSVVLYQYAIIFTLIRRVWGTCSATPAYECSTLSQLIDSIAATLQSPRADTDIDIIERVSSLPLIGLGIRNALKTGVEFFGRT